MNKDQYLAPISAMLEANGLSIDELADYQAATGGVRTAAAGPLLGGYIVKVDRGLSGNTGRSHEGASGQGNVSSTD